MQNNSHPQTNSHSKLLLFSDSRLVVYNKCNIASTKYTLLKINTLFSQQRSDSFEKLFKQLELVSHLDIQTINNGLRPRVFIHCFLVFGYPGETLALVVQILLQDHPQKHMKKKFQGFLTLLTSTCRKTELTRSVRKS